MHKILTLRTITPLHAGTGQAVGTTDLPIARERATNWPYVPGSSVKGVLKDAAIVNGIAAAGGKCRGNGAGKQVAQDLAWLFGSPNNDDAKAGNLSVTDLRLLLFPVRSLAGTFAYATCPLAIERVNELRRVAGQEQIGGVPTPKEAWIPGESTLKLDGKLYLEDLELTPESGNGAALVSGLSKLSGIRGLGERLAVLNQDLFNFLAETATEVTTHVKLNFEKRTAERGALRSEERVPSEAVFVGLATVDELMGKSEEAGRELQRLNDSPYLQFGGKASVGNGLCKVSFV